MSNNPSSIIVRYYHGGEFVCRNGKTTYERGQLTLDHGVRPSKLHLVDILNNARRLVRSDNFEVWYKMYGKNLTNGRKKLVSESDVASILASKDQLRIVSIYVTQPTDLPTHSLSEIPIIDTHQFISQPEVGGTSFNTQKPIPIITKQPNLQKSIVPITKPKKPQKLTYKRVDEKKKGKKIATLEEVDEGDVLFSSDSELSDLDLIFEEYEQDVVDDEFFVNIENSRDSGQIDSTPKTLTTTHPIITDSIETGLIETIQTQTQTTPISASPIQTVLNPTGLFGVDNLQVVLESERDDDSDELQSLHGSDDEADQYPFFNPEIDLKEKINLTLGLKFPTAYVLRESLQRHAVENGYEFYSLHNDANRISNFCKNRCDCKFDLKKTKFRPCTCDNGIKCFFKLHATRLKPSLAFQIKSMRLKHDCGYRDKNKKVNSVYLCKKYLEDWRTRPTWKLSEFQERVHKDLMVAVTYTMCWRARAKAKLLIYGDGVDEYSRVWDYVAAIRKYNPGSSAFVVCQSIHRPLPYFQRMYICLQACKEGFLQGCRPIVGVDGCHLKGAFPGMCLVAVGKDGNNNIFPVAWAVVEVENRDTWKWFLTLLLDDIGGKTGEGEGLTFMSDRQKGLQDALSSITPKADIRFCVRHIWANFKLQFTGQAFKEIFWKAARATSKNEFEHHLDTIKSLSQSAYDYLAAIPPKHWSRHAFTKTAKSNMLLNNLCETFNSVLKHARDKPILTHMEWMRRYVMKRNFEKREGVEKHEGRVMPYVDKLLKWAHEEARYCITNGANLFEFEVDHKGDRHIVNLRERKCSCFHWDLTGMPCPHAFACILKRRENPEDYVDEIYSKARYMMAYGPSISPMPGPKQWEKSGIAEPTAPPFKKLPGRPSSRKRRKEAGEGVDKNKFVKRTRKQNKCGNCGQFGHNKSTCNNQPAYKVPNKGGRPLTNTVWAAGARKKKAAKKSTEDPSHQTEASYISGSQTQ